MITLDDKYVTGLYNIDYSKYDIKSILNKCRAEMESGDVGYYRLPFAMEKILPEIEDYVNTLPQEIDTFVLVGIGGSSLGPEAIDQALRTPKTKKRFFVIDNTDPDKIELILSKLIPEKTVVNVISKSGGTLETMVNFSVVFEFMEKALGDKVKEHLVITTDPEKGPLRELAIRENIKAFSIPENVGGRFSVLTPVGLLMATFMGYDTKEMLKGAQEMFKLCWSEDLNENIPLKYALISHFLYKYHRKTISVLMPYSSKLEKFSAWYTQLWAESLGKKRDLNGNIVHSGQTPLACVGGVDQHSMLQLFMKGPNDKLVSFLKIKERNRLIVTNNVLGFVQPKYHEKEIGLLNNMQLEATSEALFQSERPNVNLEIEKLNASTLGALFIYYEFATSCFGVLEHINTYDQPGVELGKIIIKSKLE